MRGKGKGNRSKGAGAVRSTTYVEYCSRRIALLQANVCHVCRARGASVRDCCLWVSWLHSSVLLEYKLQPTEKTEDSVRERIKRWRRKRSSTCISRFFTFSIQVYLMVLYTYILILLYWWFSSSIECTSNRNKNILGFVSSWYTLLARCVFLKSIYTQAAFILNKV